LAHFDPCGSESLHADLTQAQREYFGAHASRCTDSAGTSHPEWTRQTVGGRAK
jgi:6-phosphogluconate dehydrogenase